MQWPRMDDPYKHRVLTAPAGDTPYNDVILSHCAVRCVDSKSIMTIKPQLWVNSEDSRVCSSSHSGLQSGEYYNPQPQIPSDEPLMRDRKLITRHIHTQATNLLV